MQNKKNGENQKMINTSTNNEVVVEFRNLTKKFGKFTAVSDVNIQIHKGEIVGFLGPNGAGKSTTMKMMAYLLKPTEGEVWIRGNGELEKLTQHSKEYLLNNIGFLIENPTFYSEVTPRQILTYFGELKGYPKNKIKARVEEIVALIKMTDWIDIKIGKFSKGMRQKIGIISAIVHDPDIIVMDEPHTGLDPKARAQVRDFLIQLKKSGKTIFLSSHLLYEVSEVADKVAIISNGKIIAFDTLDNLELQAQNSILNIELLDDDKINQDQMISQLSEITRSVSGVKDSKVKYNEDTGVFCIPFNGDPKNQHQIFRALFENKIPVIEFSVPKAGLLEKLYLDLIEDPDEKEGGN